MESLSNDYGQRIDVIATAIQNSELLQAYLDEEEDELYRKLVDEFEPQIDSLYKEAANNHPLQLESLEKKLLDEKYEGLYIPKMIGYAVLRGALNDEYKYIHPQEHFKEILLAMTESLNFDQIRLRTGQSIAAGFAASSDIWITNFINRIKNKNIREYFESLKSWEFRDKVIRKRTFLKFEKQFDGAVYQSSDFPSNSRELKIWYPQLKKLLLSRINKDLNNTSIVDAVVDTLSNSELYEQTEYLPLICLFSNFYDSDQRHAELSKQLNRARSSNPEFSNSYFINLKKMYDEGLPLSSESTTRIHELLDQKIQDHILTFYNLLVLVDTTDLLDESVLEKMRNFYNENAGLSDINECLRLSVLKKFELRMSTLSEDDYSEFFELNKIFAVYIDLFSNQEFNQHIRLYSLRYIKRLLKKYTDKRGRDYQDIKKFVHSTFLDYGFMNLKELKEFFKTKRMKKVVAN